MCKCRRSSVVKIGVPENGVEMTKKYCEYRRILLACFVFVGKQKNEDPREVLLGVACYGSSVRAQSVTPRVPFQKVCFGELVNCFVRGNELVCVSPFVGLEGGGNVLLIWKRLPF